MRPLRLSLVLLAVGVVICVAAPNTSQAQGLSGLGPPGGLVQVDPKSSKLEMDVLRSINAARGKNKLPPLGMDERLRVFLRNEARMMATGAPGAGKAGDKIKRQGLAPHGHHYLFVYGANAKAVLSKLEADAGTRKAMQGDFQRVGLGAFYAPDPRGAFFQVGILLVRDEDPNMGKPGLTRAQTDPVMNSAAQRIKTCYDNALRKNPNIRGDVIFSLTIGAAGKITKARYLRSLNAIEFDDCAMNVVTGLKFPKPYKGKPVTLNHPMRFEPPHGTRRLGILTPTQIRSSFRRASYDLRKCYDKALKRKPELTGTITVSLVVKPDGSQRNLKVDSNELKDPHFEKCFLDRVRQVRFPPPKHAGEVDVTYPMSFSPAQ